MSGYHAFRRTDYEDSRASLYVPPSQQEDEDDAPIILARVADFVDEPDQPLNDSTADGHSAGPAPLAVSRLTVAALVLVAGLCGFVLGRVTSPDAAADPEPWRAAPPAPAAPEAPTWESRSLTPPTSRSAAGGATPKLTTAAPNAQPAQDASLAPWAPVASWPPATTEAAPPANQLPQPQEPEPSAAGDGQPWLSANQAKALPDGPAAVPRSPVDAHPPQSDPYAAAMMARRPTCDNRAAAQPVVPPAANVPANGAADPRPALSPPMPGQPAGDRALPSAAGPSAAGQTPGYPTANYPTTNYPPTVNPWASQVAGRPIQGNPPAGRTSSDGAVRYYD